MSRILFVDDNPTGIQPIAEVVRERLAHDVTVLTRVEDVTPQLCIAEAFDLALVDLSFRATKRSGLDALLVLAECSPCTRLGIYTQGDDAVADLLRDSWEAVPLACALSKSLPLDRLIDAIDRALAGVESPVDPVLQPLLPLQRSPWRAAEGYGRLIQHAGHAKLWRALMRADADASYEELRRLSGLKINTLRNYREQLLPELALHGMAAPTIRQMQAFAWRCRPLLQPHIVRCLGE